MRAYIYPLNSADELHLSHTNYVPIMNHLQIYLRYHQILNGEWIIKQSVKLVSEPFKHARAHLLH